MKEIKINVEIDESNYSLSCKESEKEYIALLAEKVNKVVAEVKSKTGNCSVSSLFVICLIKMQDEIEKKERIVSEAIDAKRKTTLFIENESSRKAEKIIESMTKKIERIINDIAKDIEEET